MNKILIKGVQVALLGIIGLAAVSCKQAPGNQAGRNNYNVLEITLSDKTLTNSYPATLRGKQDVDIRPQVSGIITELLVTEGEVVRKGQPLFIIDQVPYQAALQTAVANVEAAEANVATAQLTADSKKELYTGNVVSEYDLQTAMNTLKSQQAALAQAKAEELNARNNLSYTIVKSPSDGVVGTLPYRIGALVSSSINTPLTTISDNSEMYVYFSMTENQVLSLSRQNGTLQNAVSAMPEINLQLNDGTMYTEKGKVETMSGMIDGTTGAVSVRAVFPNKERILLSGGAGNVVFPYEKKDCITIPQAATYETQDKVFVYKIVDGVTQSAEINVFYLTDGKEYIVESGLKPGDRIVAEGVGLLRNGVQVQAKVNN